MLKTLIVLGLLSSQVFAGHLDSVCEKSIQHDPNIPQRTLTNPPVFAENLISRRGPQGTTVLEDMSGNLLNKFLFPISALIKTENKIWALAPFDLIEMNMKGEILNTHNFESSGNPAWKALGMVMKDNIIVISRGPAGVLAFDTNTLTVKWQNTFGDENDGYPSGIALNGNKIYVASATSHEFGFTGIQTLDFETGNVIKRTPYHRDWGVLDTEARAHMYQGNLVLNNGGWIHKITPEQIESGKSIKPRWVAKLLPADGEVNAHYMMNNGDFFFEGKDLVGCGVFTAKENQVLVRKSKLYKLEMP